MALFFKPFRGVRALLDAQELHDGYVHFCTDDGSFHIDFADADGNLQRKQISAKDAETLTGMTLEEIKAYVTVQSNWEQNDPDQPDYVKGRTHWEDENGEIHKLDKKFLPDDMSFTQVPADWNAAEGESGYVKNRTHYIAYDSIESSDSVTAPQRIYANVAIKVTDRKLIVNLGSSNYGVKFQENAYIVIYVEGSRYDVDLSAHEATTYKEPLAIVVGYHNGYAVTCTCRPSARFIQITGSVQVATYEEGLENPNLPLPKMRIEYGTTTLVPLDEIYIPNSIPKVQAATVGQTVVVKTVDENGKPTEWEASDFSSTQVQPDWLQADDSEADYIKNKPSPVDYNIEQDLTDEQKGLARANIGISGLITEDTILDLLGEVNAIAPLADDDGALLVDGDEILLL
jgi:hypothetical protein